jgi:dTDP-4-amino-4,6-dideoxygalactose transaminase
MIRSAAAAAGVPVIEDAAQRRRDIVAAVGGPVVGCFVLPEQEPGAFGDAGLLTTNDDRLAKRAPC